MKITLDTKLKDISLHEEVNAEELFNALENLLPNGLWKEFKIKTSAINNWTDPIVIPYAPVYPANPNPFPIQPAWPLQPTWTPMNPNYPWITICQNTGVDDSGVTFTALNAGVYNVEFEK